LREKCVPEKPSKEETDKAPESAEKTQEADKRDSPSMIIFG
jgi:hypothetical protein